MIKKAKKLDILIMLFGIIAAAVYPLVFLWMSNVKLVEENGRIWLTIAILVSGSGVLFGLLLLVCRNASRAFLITVTVILIFENGAFLHDCLTRLAPALRYWHTAAILFVISSVVAYVLMKLGNDASHKVSKIVSLLFVAFVCFNIVSAIPRIINRDSGIQPLEDRAQVVEGGNGKNMYWLTFDEYSNNKVFEKYFNYDNTKFTDALEEMGFNVSYTSANETISSIVIATNISNFAYVMDWVGDPNHAETLSAAQDSAILIPLVESHGYEVIGIGSAHMYGFKGKTVAAKSESGVTANGEDTTMLFWKQTAAWPAVKINVNARAQNALSQFRYLQDADNIPAGSTFVLAHFGPPHRPYMFRSDGSILPDSAYFDSTYYVGQCQFINGEIIKIVSTIIKNDPDAIIAVVSDHSFRRYEHMAYSDKRSILASLYNGGAETDIEGMTGMNIMITMFNEALGTDIQYVEPTVQEEPFALW